MSLTIELSEDAERELFDHATALGQTPEYIAASMIERMLAIDSIDRVLAPFRKQVSDSGMTESELDAFFQEVREEVWQEQQMAAK